MLEGRESSLRKRVFDKDLEEVRMGAFWIYGESLQSRKPASAKALRWWAWCVQNSKGISAAGAE